MKELFNDKLHETEFEKMAYGLVRISYKLLGGDRMTLNYGTDVKIHGSEIHLLCHIKRNPGSHISGIARELNVTRGAISQIVAKLEKKGLVVKDESPESKKILLLKTTEKGEKAYKGHQLLHSEFNSRLLDIMSGHDENETKIIEGFVKDLENSVDELILKVYSDDYFEKKNL